MSKLAGQGMLLLLAFVAGAVSMYTWQRHQLRQDAALLAELETSNSVWTPNLEQASTAPGLVDEQAAANAVQPLAEHSQLSKIEVPEIQSVVTRSGTFFEPEGNDSSAQDTTPVLDENAVVVVPVATPGTAVPAPADTKISMIEAPVQALVINSVEQYREFKQRARGSYPQADFDTQQVLVLESTSNLPDKVFEIISLTPEDGKLVVRYRVNVFGLDKKTNTHSAVVMEKQELPLSLIQVL